MGNKPEEGFQCSDGREALGGVESPAGFVYAPDACEPRLPEREQDRSPYRSITKLFEIPIWDRWPTQSPVCGGDDGVSDRLDGITFPKWRTQSVKAYGNAVVPQVVLQIFKAIELFEKMQY